jgi:hypothetical protein
VGSLAVIAMCACTKPTATSPARPPSSATPQKNLTRTEPLPEHALDVLQKMMMAHGEEMDMLFWSVLLFDYESAQKIATGMAERRQRAAAEPGATETLDDFLPEEFFRLQDNFESAALALADAAKNKNDKAMAQTYGELVTTCVTCHAVYMEAPLRLSDIREETR